MRRFCWALFSLVSCNAYSQSPVITMAANNATNTALTTPKESRATRNHSGKNVIIHRASRTQHRQDKNSGRSSQLSTPKIGGTKHHRKWRYFRAVGPSSVAPISYAGSTGPNDAFSRLASARRRFRATRQSRRLRIPAALLCLSGLPKMQLFVRYITFNSLGSHRNALAFGTPLVIAGRTADDQRPT